MSDDRTLSDASRDMMTGYLARLSERLCKPPYGLSTKVAVQTIDAILQSANSIYEKNTDRISDNPSQGHLKFCSMLLATYRALKERRPDDDAVLADLDDVLVQPFRDRIHWWLDVRFGVRAETPDETFETMAANFAARGARQFGDSFEYVEEANDETRSLVQIKKCFFKSFFHDNGAPEVTPILCAMDMVWADEINSGPYNVRFERPSLLSLGADACRFYFYREKAAS